MANHGSDADGETAPLHATERLGVVDHGLIRDQDDSIHVIEASSASQPNTPFLKSQHDPTTTNNPHGEKAQRPEARNVEVLHRQRAALSIFLLYALVAMLSWSFTCVLSKHPIGISTFHDQYGAFSREQYHTSDRLRRASSVGLNIIFAVGILTTSSIAARASAAYCQRNSAKDTRLLTLRQMLALADKGWANYEYIRDMLNPRKSKAVTTPLMVFVTSLITIAFLLPILYAIFVSTKQIRVYAKEDQKVTNQNQIGSFITPSSIIGQDHNRTIQNVILDTINSQFSDSQPYLWTTRNRTSRMTNLAAVLAAASDIVGYDDKSYNGSGYKTVPSDYFSTSFPVGSDTGLLRNLATRLNTSVDCEIIPPDAFPAQCSTDDAFVRDFSNINNGSNPTPFFEPPVLPGHPRYRIRICVPGPLSKSPWQNVATRQDVHEDLWIDFQSSSPTYFEGGRRGNYTQHCTSNSTLGFFEVPNYWNGYAVGPLLAQPPPLGPNYTYQNSRILTLNWSSLSHDSQVPGPLMASALAIFGPTTFFDIVANSTNNKVMNYSPLGQALCSQLRYPFAGLNPQYNYLLDGATIRNLTTWNIPYQWEPCERSAKGSSDLLRGLLAYMPQFSTPENMMAALTMTVYSLHKHLLTTTALTNVRQPTYSSEGTASEKIDMSITGMIVISVLLFYQLCGLGYLAFYAYNRPVWTDTLDAKAILKLGAEIVQTRDMTEFLPKGMRLSTSPKEMARLLDETEGWVGRSAQGW